MTLMDNVIVIVVIAGFAYLILSGLKKKGHDVFGYVHNIREKYFSKKTGTPVAGEFKQQVYPEKVI